MYLIGSSGHVCTEGGMAELAHSALAGYSKIIIVSTQLKQVTVSCFVFLVRSEENLACMYMHLMYNGQYRASVTLTIIMDIHL